MKIESVSFVMSAVRAPDFTDGVLAEIAMSGRSNVGKSSLLNSLFARKGMAKVSGTPGKTQCLNYFLVNESFHLVDLPGYGYAKAPGDVRNRWGQMMQGYLRNCRQLVGLVQLVDVRHLPSREDREMVQWLRDEKLPFCLVATKCDKLSQTAARTSIGKIVKALELPATQPVIAYSSETGDGRPALLAWIGEALQASASA